MSEEIKPGATNAPDVEQEETKTTAEKIVEKVAEVVQEAASKVDELKEEVKETIEETADQAAEVKDKVVNYADKTLAQLSELFDELVHSEDRLKRSKEAESIKSAFYKKLSKGKAEAGLDGAVDEPSDEDAPAEEQTSAETENDSEAGPFAAIEAGFKSLYNTYRKERAEYNRRQEEERESNLQKKQAVIEDLKALLEKQEDVNATFPEFRAIQDRWRETGPVPVQSYKDLNNTYQFYVEKFYDMVKINRDLRDLDFKKNLEAKEQLCEEAEKLAENENVVEAFRELQKLHEQWKDFGPVAKEFRESIWARFVAATAVINKKYQAYFERMKSQQVLNLEAKTKLCEQVEEIASREITVSNEWNALSKEIENLQQEWRMIGFATKKENQRIYDRFRAACDKFFERKREFYAKFKDTMNENMEKKLAIIEQAEALKNSTEWKKTSDTLINLQKRWKEIGAVPRKKSEQLWKRFRAACDEFFNERDKHVKPENDFYGNLKAKRKLLEEVEAFVPTGDAAADSESMQDFAGRWNAIGFVPFREKDALNKSYRDLMHEKFPQHTIRDIRGASRGLARSVRSEKDRLVDKYNKLQQDIVTYENNIAFFSKSKNSEPFIKQIQDSIDQAKAQLKELENKIREAEASEKSAEE